MSKTALKGNATQSKSIGLSGVQRAVYGSKYKEAKYDIELVMLQLTKGGKEAPHETLDSIIV